MSKDNWFIFTDIDKLSEQLVHDILDIAEKTIQLNNNFKIVLAGGTSLINLYKLLSNSKSDWHKWQIYIGDERCLPLEDRDRNDHNINKVWLNGSTIPKQNINFMRAELGPNNAALHYEDVLKNVGDFDVVLLSVGEDGHTASLFPGHLYDKNRSVVVECNSPKYPKDRISMSYSRLDQSKNIFKVINGSSKQGAVDLWLKGVVLPVNKINGHSEKVFICEDALFTRT
jgi:6-phosphogluconolactonase